MSIGESAKYPAHINGLIRTRVRSNQSLKRRAGKFKLLTIGGETAGMGNYTQRGIATALYPGWKGPGCCLTEYGKDYLYSLVARKLAVGSPKIAERYYKGRTGKEVWAGKRDAF